LCRSVRRQNGCFEPVSGLCPSRSRPSWFSLLTVRLAIRATCGNRDLTYERSINYCHGDEVRSSRAAGNASARRLIHGRDRQFSKMSVIRCFQGKQLIVCLKRRKQRTIVISGWTHGKVVMWSTMPNARGTCRFLVVRKRKIGDKEEENSCNPQPGNWVFHELQQLKMAVCFNFFYE